MSGLLPGGLITPPSPFRRSGWKRFTEDTWPAVTAAWARFWLGPYRGFVLGALVVAGLALFGFSLRRLQPVSGQVVHEGGRPASGTEVTLFWYLSRVRGFENELRPLTFTHGEINDSSASETVLRSARATTDAEGRFHFPGGWALGWPGGRGPFLSLRLQAADRLSGRVYPVPRFLTGDGREVAGSFDSALAAGGDVARLIGRLELEAPRVLDLQVEGDRLLTAEGIAGVRLYRRSGRDRVELAGHHPGAENLLARAAGFERRAIAAFTTRGYERLDPAAPALPTLTLLAGEYQRLLGTTERGPLLAAANAVVVVSPTDPPTVVEKTSLGDSGTDVSRLGPDVLALLGSLLVYHHSDGTVRAADLAGAQRAPHTLSHKGLSAAAWGIAGDGRTLLVASRSGVAGWSFARSEMIERLGDVALDLGPLAIHDRAVLGARGVAVLRLLPTSLAIEHLVPLEIDEVEAASAFLRGNELVVPKIDEILTRIEERELRWDPRRGTTEAGRQSLRDQAQLVGCRVVDLATGAWRQHSLEPAVWVRVRPDGRNRMLVQGVFPDGVPVYALADGRLLVHPWPAAPPGPAAAIPGVPSPTPGGDVAREPPAQRSGPRLPATRALPALTPAR